MDWQDFGANGGKKTAAEAVTKSEGIDGVKVVQEDMVLEVIYECQRHVAASQADFLLATAKALADRHFPGASETLFMSLKKDVKSIWREYRRQAANGDECTGPDVQVLFDKDGAAVMKRRRLDLSMQEASSSGCPPAAAPVQLAELKFSAPLSEFTKLPRKECKKCGKKRKYYCYNCIAPIYPEHHKHDLVLPLQLYIYKHFNEKNSRSTAIHAALVSPDVHIFEYPDLGPELDPEVTLVLYPSPEAVSLAEVENLEKYKNVVVIEATWQQSRCISREPQVLKYKRIRLDDHASIFWRYQSKDDSYLATIEAIYFFFVEYKNAILASQGSGNHYSGEYDDLLFFYSHIYQTIQHSYKADRTLEYTPRGRPGYIRYDEEDPLLKSANAVTAVYLSSPPAASPEERDKSPNGIDCEDTLTVQKNNADSELPLAPEPLSAE